MKISAGCSLSARPYSLPPPLPQAAPWRHVVGPSGAFPRTAGGIPYPVSGVSRLSLCRDGINASLHHFTYCPIYYYYAYLLGCILLCILLIVCIICIIRARTRLIFYERLLVIIYHIVILLYYLLVCILRSYILSYSTRKYVAIPSLLYRNILYILCIL